jgi:hypothetical protein
VNSATALVGLVLLTVNTQGFVAPEHGPAVQLVNEYPVAGVAVNVTCVPEVKFVEHALGGAGFAQLISGVTVGVEVLVTIPFPVNATVKLLVCAVNSAFTVCAPDIATTHFFSDVIKTHGPVQPAKFEVEFCSAVRVLSCPLWVKVCVHVPVVLVPFITQSMAVAVPPMFPVTVPPPVAPLPAGATVSVGVPVPRLNVAISCSGFSFTVNVQVVLVAGHCVGVTAPLHPANTEPGLAVSAKVTTDPFAYVVSQALPTPPCPFALVQLIWCGVELSITVPNAFPSNCISNVSLVADPTVIVTLAIAVPGNVALIVAVSPPPVSAVTSPVLLTVTAVGLEELHVTLSVKS